VTPPWQAIERELKKCREIDALMEAGKYKQAMKRLRHELGFTDYDDFQVVRGPLEATGEWKYVKRSNRKRKLTRWEQLLETAKEEEEEALQDGKSVGSNQPIIEEEPEDFLVDPAEKSKACTWK